MAVLGGVAASVWVATDRLSELSFDVGSERRHLEPVPIDRAAACPHVESVHAEAQRFVDVFSDGSWPGVGLLTADDWTVRQLELDQAMARLDFAVAAALPTLPAQVQIELAAVRQLLAEGRLRLAATTAGGDLIGPATRLYSEGQQHLGWAGDLVGAQCAVPLAV